MELSTETYDVAIVGAGPAGSSAAIRLSTAGLKVLLVEQKAFPRHKLCGEFISPECLPHFAELGVLPEIRAAGAVDLQETIFYSRRGKSVGIKSTWFGENESLGLGLSRAELDSLLVERARQAGADVLMETTAFNLLVENQTVTGVRLRDAAGRESTIRTALTIDASGRSRSLTRRFEDHKAKTAAEFVAFKAYVRGAQLMPSTCEMYVYKGGYGGCNRVEGDLFNLCFIVSAELTKRYASDPERVMREVVCSNPRAAEALRSAEIASEWFAVPITQFGRGDLSPANGLLAIGDAAAFIDPFTGSGILLALESGKIAASAIVDEFAKGSDAAAIAVKFRDRYSAAFDSRLRICKILRHAAFLPRLADLVIAILGSSRSLSQAIARRTRAGSGPTV